MDIKKRLKMEINFSQFSVAVFGDIMLDKYIYGNVDRISPEAPIPVVVVNQEKYVPGGAANVAANIAALGAKTYLFGITGTGTPAEVLFKEVESAGINTMGVLRKKDVHTIQKIRIIGQSQQLVRLDYESDNYWDVKINGAFFSKLQEIKNLSAIIISDYAKGTINAELMKEIKDFAHKRDVPVFVDPKPVNRDIYNEAYLITPNLKEAEGLCNMKLNTIEKINSCGLQLQKRYNSNIIITRGADGMSLYEKNKYPVHIPTLAKQVFDVSGAGDTVIVTLCLSVVAGNSLNDAVNIANHAAGIKVGKLGTASVTYDELKKELVKV